jgi:hypothetical protein
LLGCAFQPSNHSEIAFSRLIQPAGLDGEEAVLGPFMAAREFVRGGNLEWVKDSLGPVAAEMVEGEAAVAAVRDAEMQVNSTMLVMCVSWLVFYLVSDLCG